MKDFIAALKEDRDGIRKNLLTTVGTVLGSIILGVALTKVADSKMDVLVVEETRPEPILVPVPQETDNG